MFVLYPHQTRYVVPAQAAFVLPESVPPARAVLAANLETAINGLWDARPHVGDRVAIVGAGTVGCLVAWLAGRRARLQVELVDINPHRAAVATALGVRFATPDSASEGADVVIHTSGCRPVCSWHCAIAGSRSDDRRDELVRDADRAARARRSLSRAAPDAQVVAGRQGVAGAAGTMGQPPTARACADTACGPALDVLITGESDFDDLPETMARLAAAPDGALCHRIRYL